MTRSLRPAPPGEGNVSAALFLEQRRLAEETLGVEVVERAVSGMSEEARAELASLLPVSWCSLRTSTEFYYAVAEEIGEDPMLWHRRMTRLGLERTFNTIWRFFMRITTVEGLVRRAGTVYGRSYDVGTLTVTEASSDIVRGAVNGWPGIPEFEVDAITSGIEAMLAISGRKVKVAWERTPDGMRFEVRLGARGAMNA